MRDTARRFWKRLAAAAIVAAAGAAALWAAIPLAVQFHSGRARQFLQQQDNPRALRELRTALRLQPRRPETYFLLARTHRRLGNLDQVEPLLRVARQLGGDPDRAQRETWMAWAQAGRMREAEPHLSELLVDLREDGAEICAAYVQGYLANLQPAAARRLLDAWQRDYPQDPQAYFLRGYLNQTLTLWHEAAEAYRRGLELSPGETRMRIRLAEVLAERGEVDEALRQFERCAGETPGDASLFAAWAHCLTQQGRPDQARPILQRALESASMHFESLRQLGELELAAGDYERALPPLQAAVSQRPYDAASRAALGKTLQALGRADEAQSHLEYAAAAEQPLAQMRQHLRQLHQRPHDPQLRYEIGATLLQFGSPPDGARWLHTALELDPAHAEAHQALAEYYERVGDREQAAEHRAASRQAREPSGEAESAGTRAP